MAEPPDAPKLPDLPDPADLPEPTEAEATDAGDAAGTAGVPDPTEAIGVERPPEGGVPLSADPSGIGRKLPVGPAAAMFLGIGAFVAVVTAIYWFTAYEDAGTVMLLLTAAMALWFGAYLWLRQRRAETAEEPTATEAAIGSSYLPDASVWPFVMGLGAATLVNGFVLGIWVVVPGAAALAFGLGGFIRQTRRRD
jgi:hypothetical protein